VDEFCDPITALVRLVRGKKTGQGGSRSGAVRFAV
jgi:hypothetical protein